MNNIAKKLLAAVAVLTAATAMSGERSETEPNEADSYTRNPAGIASLVRKDAIDDVGEIATANFGLGILEGASGLFGFPIDGSYGDYFEEPPPNPLYPAPMEKNALYFGGTDWGRFIPETLVLNDGVRPDVSIITQNALADDNYMAVIRERYGKKCYIPSKDDMVEAFSKFVEGVQSGKIDARDSLEIKDGRVTVTGSLAVMKINEILAKKVFEKNKGKHAMYVEESYPVEWMLDYMTPHGLVMKLNAEKPGAVSDEDVRDNAEFWDWMVKRLLSSEQFASRRAEHCRKAADGKRDRNRDPFHRMGVRAFSKLRLAHARLYAHHDKNPAAFATAIRQAAAIDPQDPETGWYYAAFLELSKLDAAREDFLGCLKKLGVDTDGWR